MTTFSATACPLVGILFGVLSIIMAHRSRWPTVMMRTLGQTTSVWYVEMWHLAKTLASTLVNHVRHSSGETQIR